MKNLKDMTIREVYEGAEEEGGKPWTWKAWTLVVVAFILVMVGLLGSGRYMFLVPRESMNMQLGWIYIGIMTVGGLIVCVVFPLYMSWENKKEGK